MAGKERGEWDGGGEGRGEWDGGGEETGRVGRRGGGGRRNRTRESKTHPILLSGDSRLVVKLRL